MGSEFHSARATNHPVTILVTWPVAHSLCNNAASERRACKCTGWWQAVSDLVELA